MKKIIITAIISGIICSSLTVIAGNYNAKQINYTPNDTTWNVKNVSSEKHKLNMFYYDVFGSQGVELASVSAYFDNAIDYAGELKPSASYKSNFYFLYDGDGKYSIDFDNYDEKLSVEFDITK